MHYWGEKLEKNWGMNGQILTPNKLYQYFFHFQAKVQIFIKIE